VICAANGAPIDLTYENEKGYKKSLEQGQLWVIHEETGRLLPYRDQSRVEVSDHGAWYHAILVERNAESRSGTPADAKASPAPTGTRADGPVSEAPASTGDQLDFGSVATALAALVAERKQQMPEGSYTTHLFSSGAEKIRKKLGEEAVELILAPDRERLVSETADLIYHLLVLLASEGVTLADVATELEKR
jgi:phosphoribosyl-ATP pyrophosphohydrolase